MTTTLEPGLPEHVLALLHEREPSAGAARGVGLGGREGIEPAYLQLVMRRLWERERPERLRRAAHRDAERDGQPARDRQRAPRRRRWPAHARRAPADGGRVPLPGHAVRREDRPAPERPRPAHRRARRTTSPAPLEKLAGGDARILRPVDDAPSYEIFHDVLAQPLLDWQARFHAARLQRRAAALGMAAAAAAAIVLVLVAYILAAGVAREGRAEDARRPVRAPRRRARSDATSSIVDLDDASLAALGAGGDRIPRRLHARMIDTLRTAGAGGDRLRRRVPRADPRGRGAQEGDRARRPAAAACRHPDRQRGPGRDPGRSRRRAAGERRVRRVPDLGGRRLPRGGRVGRPLRRRPVRARHPPAGELRGRRRGPGRRPGRALRAGLDRLPRARAHVPARSVHGRARRRGPAPLRGQGRRGRHVGAQAGRPARDGGRRRPGHVGCGDPGQRHLDAAPGNPAR